MLVLSRKPGQEVCIGHNVTVVVLEVSGSRVRVGIKAPSDVTIRRAELVFQSSEFSRSTEDHESRVPVEIVG